MIKYSEIILQLETGGNEAQRELFEALARSVWPASRGVHKEYYWTSPSAAKARKGRDVGWGRDRQCRDLVPRSGTRQGPEETVA